MPRIFSLNAHRMQFITLLFCGASLPLFAFANAETEVLNDYNQISFSVTVNESVKNDIANIRFNAYAKASSANEVTDRINQQMQEAQEVLRGRKDLVVNTQHYQIRPVYNKSRAILHWTGQQTLQISTQNLPGLVDLLAEIQPFVQYSGMHFSLSADKQAEIKKRLTEKGLQAYQAQAKHIANSFGQSQYRITATQIGYTPPLQPYRKTYNMRDNLAMSAEMAAPVVEAGESQQTLTVSGLLVISNEIR